MTKEQKLKIYAAYLPYGLKGRSIYNPNDDDSNEDCTLALRDGLNNEVGIDDWVNQYSYPIKPYLYDLSYLTKEIEHEEKFVPSEVIIKYVGAIGDYFEIKADYILIRRNGMIKYKIIWAGKLADDCMLWIYDKLLGMAFQRFQSSPDQFINKATLKQ